MPHYFFHLRDGHSVIRDPVGMVLPDIDSARVHASQVARELMRNSEVRSRSWLLSVCTDTDGESCFDLLFASVDNSMDHLTPEWRRSVEDVCRSTAALNATINQVSLTLRQVKRTIAECEGAPYLATLYGTRI